MAASFKLMTKDESCSWQQKMHRADFKRVRQVIIQTVLATDMTKHFSELGHLNSRMRDEDFDPVEVKDKELFIKFTFHLSDISNPTKPWHLCRLWADLIFIEFFQQGDLEKSHEFPVSQFYDRTTTNVAKSQIGFIDFIIKPSFMAVGKVFPNLVFLEAELENNKSHWTSMFDEYETKKENGNEYTDIIQDYLPRKTKISLGMTPTGLMQAAEVPIAASESELRKIKSRKQSLRSKLVNSQIVI